MPEFLFCSNSRNPVLSEKTGRAPREQNLVNIPISRIGLNYDHPCQLRISLTASNAPW